MATVPLSHRRRVIRSVANTDASKRSAQPLHVGVTDTKASPIDRHETLSLRAGEATAARRVSAEQQRLCH